MPPVASHDALVAARGKLTVKRVAKTRRALTGDVMVPHAATLPQRRAASHRCRQAGLAGGRQPQARDELREGIGASSRQAEEEGGMTR